MSDTVSTAIQDAVEDAIDLILGELGIDDGTPESDLVDLVRQAILERLENPGASFDEVVNARVDGTPEEVRGWWHNWG